MLKIQAKRRQADSVGNGSGKAVHNRNPENGQAGKGHTRTGGKVQNQQAVE